MSNVKNIYRQRVMAAEFFCNWRQRVPDS